MFFLFLLWRTYAGSAAGVQLVRVFADHAHTGMIPDRKRVRGFQIFISLMNFLIKASCRALTTAALLVDFSPRQRAYVAFSPLGGGTG